jgi:hypothetical protein
MKAQTQNKKYQPEYRISHSYAGLIVLGVTLGTILSVVWVFGR